MKTKLDGIYFFIAGTQSEKKNNLTHSVLGELYFRDVSLWISQASI